MTEAQSERIIQLLEKIAESIGNIENNFLYGGNLYELSDVVKSKIADIANTANECEKHLDRLETMMGHLPWDGG